MTSADALETLAPSWHAKAPTPRCMHQRIRAVLEWAMELETDNPCDRLAQCSDRNTTWSSSCGLCRIARVATANRTARASTALPSVRLAFEFLVLIAARWGEGRVAVWSEMDHDAACGRFPQAT